VRKLNPSSEDGFLLVGYSQIGQGQLDQATQTYQELQKLGPRGASLAASALANMAMYQGKYREAQKILESAIKVDLSDKQPDRAADNLAMLSATVLSRGDKAAAISAAQKALSSSQSEKIKFLTARSYVETGEVGKAREVATALSSQLQSEPQAYSKMILAEIALKEHDAKQAIQLLTDAQNLVDIWIVHFDLGRAYLEAGAVAEADGEFDRCIKRRGEALELFSDDMPTYSYLPPVYYFQGRARDGLKSSGAVDSYKAYLDIRGAAGEDPLLPEIRKRLKQ
jgi:eukaryotic-like serine/threonine-protein kinase